MPESDLSLLIEAARAAGKIATKYFGASPKVWDKSDGAGPVTEADLSVNDMLSATLRSARPDYGWLSEETEDDAARLGTTRQFVIDPIDGTRAFIAGSHDWAHSLAVVEDGQVIAGCVYLPMRDEMYSAYLGGGAFLNGVKIHASKQASFEKIEVLTTKPNLRPEHWEGGIVPTFNVGFRSSLAYRLCLVAQGRFDAMLTLRPTWEWDVAAGVLIVEEAMGRATDGAGQTLRFNNKNPQVNGVVAAGSVHPKILDQLA